MSPNTESRPDAFQAWTDRQHQAKRDALAEFLSERLSELSGIDQAGVQDLTLRLWGKAEETPLRLRSPFTQSAVILGDVALPVSSASAAEIDAKIAADESLVCAEMARLLNDTAERVARLRTQNEMPDQFSDLIERIEAKHLTMSEAEGLPWEWIDPGLAYRVHLALVWPDALAGWKKQRKAQTEFLRFHREVAAAYAKEQSRPWNLTESELESLAALLAGQDLQYPADEEALHDAAARNHFVRDAVNAHERWKKEQEKEPGRQNEVTWRMGFAFHWDAVWRDWSKEHAARLAARRFLLFKSAEDELAKHENAEGRLEQAVRELMPAALKALPVVPVDKLSTLGERNGMFARDADFVDFIEGLPHKESKGHAADWRKSWREDWSQNVISGAAEPWNRWKEPLRVPHVLAHVLWALEVKPTLERELGRKDSAGLASPVLTNIVGVARRGAQVGLFEDKAYILNNRGQKVGEVRMGPTIDGRVMKLEALGTLAAQRLLRFVIWGGYQKRFIHQDPNYAELWIEGGWKALAEEFGQKAGKATQEIRDAAYALDAISIDTPTGMGRIFAVHEHKPGPGRPARIEMHLLGPLRPGYVADELSSHRKAENKRIVPVPMPNRLPPMAGREQDWASQAQMQLLALRELRTHAEEMAALGFVEISEKRWRELSEEAAVPLRILSEVLNVFVSGNKEAPAFLTRPKGWVFNLSDAYEAERKAIISAGEAATRGRAAGRKSAASKAAGRFGNKGRRRG